MGPSQGETWRLKDSRQDLGAIKESTENAIWKLDDRETPLLADLVVAETNLVPQPRPDFAGG